MNKSTLAMIAFCLGGAQAAHAAGSSVDLQNLEVLGESRVDAKAFHHMVNPSSGNWSNSDITDGNWSNSDITADTWSNSDITDGNWSNSDITDATWSNSDVTGDSVVVHDAHGLPAPASRGQ